MAQKKSRELFTKGDQMNLVFVERPFYFGDKVFARTVAILPDGREIKPQSRRFKPVVGTDYPCSVIWRKSARGRDYGLAMPSMPYTLSPEEWVPADSTSISAVLTETLTFREMPAKGNRPARLMAYDHEGRIIFLDRQSKAIAGQPTQCVIVEAMSCGFAIPLTLAQATTGSAIVKLGEMIGEITLDDLKHVLVSSPKPLVRDPKSPADFGKSSVYRSIYDLLSDAKENRMVDERSSADEIRRAYAKRVGKVHPDKVLAPFGGQDKAPIVLRLKAQYYFDAMRQAYERALELIERRIAPKAEATVEQTAVSPPAEEASVPPTQETEPVVEAVEETATALEPEPAAPSNAPAVGAPVTLEQLLDAHGSALMFVIRDAKRRGIIPMNLTGTPEQQRDVLKQKLLAMRAAE